MKKTLQFVGIAALMLLAGCGNQCVRECAPDECEEVCAPTKCVKEVGWCAEE